MTEVWTAVWIASSPTSTVSSRIAASSLRNAGAAEARSRSSRRWVSPLIAAWVRRALCHVAMRLARPATAIPRNATANTRLKLGALRVIIGGSINGGACRPGTRARRHLRLLAARSPALYASRHRVRSARHPARSEEHTSELQSRLHLVCRLLLEKKKKKKTKHAH